MYLAQQAQSKPQPAMPCKNMTVKKMSQWGNCLLVVIVGELSVGEMSVGGNDIVPSNQILQNMFYNIGPWMSSILLTSKTQMSTLMCRGPSVSGTMSLL